MLVLCFDLRVEKSSFHLSIDCFSFMQESSASSHRSLRVEKASLQLLADCFSFRREFIASFLSRPSSSRTTLQLLVDSSAAFEANSTTLSKASSGKAPLVCRLLQLLSSRHHQLLSKSFEWKLLHFNYSSPLQCPSRVSDVFQLFANTASSTRVDSLRMLNLQSSNSLVNSIHVLAVWRR